MQETQVPKGKAKASASTRAALVLPGCDGSHSQVRGRRVCYDAVS